VGLLGLALLAPAGCSDDEPDVGEARLEVEGRAIVERRDGDEEVIDDDDTDLRAGDRVEVTEGVGRMVLRDGVRMELRAGIEDAADSMVRMGEVPVLEAGDLLVAAPESSAVEAAGTTVVVEAGAAQVSRALGLGVATYDGMVRIDSAGVERPVPALREMRVPALGRPPRQARPLDYAAADPWDRRFLGAAIDLGRTLEALADGYTQNLNPGEGRTPGFFRLVLPGLDDEDQFGAELIDLDRAPGETLIGAAITELGRRGGFVERWDAVFGFRDEGAEWGLVALDQDVDGTPLLGAVEDAVGASPLTFAAGPGAGGPGSTPSPAPVGDPTTPTTQPPTSPEPPPTTTPPTSPPPTSPPPTVPEEPETPLSPVLDPILDPVVEAAEDLLGGLLGP
jgi:hypothetical protein